jgi:hypothetical protein
MSTKTTFKRIALVAVAALGFGTVSTVSAFATDVATWDVALAASKTNSISLAAASTATVGSAVSVNFGASVTTTTVTAGDHGQYTTYTGYLSSYPSSGFVQVSAGTAVGTATALTGATTANSGSSATIKQTAQGTAIGTDAVTATAIVGISKFSFTPTVAGSYVLTVWNDADGDGTVDIGEAVQTLSITVSAAAGYSNTLSTSLRDFPDDSNDATRDEEIRVSKTAGTNAAQIKVTVKNTSGSALNGQILYAEVSGSGLVGSNTTGTYADGTARSTSTTLTGANVGYVNVTADGTAGEGTITIKIKDPVTLETLGTLATEKVYFYGTVASLVATANASIARANATERGCASATACTYDDFATTPFVTIVAKDADGNLVPGAALTNAVTAKITDTAVIAASTVTAVTATASATTAGITTDPNGLGYFNASVAGNVLATSGQSTTVVYRTLLADGSTYVTSNAITLKIGGSAYTHKLTLDKQEYAAGDAMVVTLSAVDASGNPVYDGAASPEVSFTKAVGGASQTIAASEYLGGTVSTSATKPVLFAPVVAGEFSARATAAVSGVSTQIVTKASVSSTGTAAEATAQAAADAAAEATDAANAATDAANAAAEAADAATAAAQDAADAVAALSTQVSSAIDALKKQIVALTNLVIKIQKKVKA